jgi:hypothetical protein
MSEMAYAVHTGTCTYLLDEDGICRWTLSPTGAAAPGTDRCVGAQFVASLDLNEAGGLVGELRIGAAALFARVEGGRYVLLRTAAIEHVEFRGGEAEGAGEVVAAAPQPSAPRKVAAPLQQTGLMEPRLPQPSFPQLDHPAPRPAPAFVAPPPPPVPAAPPPRPSTPPPLSARAPSQAPPPPSHPPRPAAPPPPAPAIRAALPSAEEIHDVEELSVEDLVTFSEVTLTIPLYRPETQPERPAPPPRRGMIGQGKRLR